MSLKTIHLILIIASIGVSVFFGAWALSYAAYAGNTVYRIVGGAAFLIAALLTAYAVFFVKEMRNQHVQ